MRETQRSEICRLIFVFESNVLNRESAFDANAVIESNVVTTTRSGGKFFETKNIWADGAFNHYI